MLLVISRLFFARCRYVQVIAGCVLLVVGRFRLFHARCRSFLAHCRSFQVVPRFSKYCKKLQQCKKTIIQIDTMMQLACHYNGNGWVGCIPLPLTPRNLKILSYNFYQKYSLMNDVDWWCRHFGHVMHVNFTDQFTVISQTDFAGVSIKRKMMSSINLLPLLNLKICIFPFKNLVL